MMEEARATAAQAFPLARNGQVLARRPARQQGDAAKLGAVQRGDIAVERRVGPMAAQHGPSVRLDFGVGYAMPASAVEAQRQPASSGE
jgi:hypothetical protein